ncbi:kinesin-like protein KIF11 [Empidonax traillii]|uniref:kinesin-like protein KIF11 n=1 Tax=Empidonax traillii TaxID=164674 RepID=UPI000FFD9C45|nr:kinesin-like protein KIF11 [Empidonax traillii]
MPSRGAPRPPLIGRAGRCAVQSGGGARGSSCPGSASAPSPGIGMASFGSQGGGTAKKEEKGKNIQVVVRCRPFNASELKASSHPVVDCDQARKEVSVRTGGVTDKTSKKTYTFDMVFGPQAKQIDVYRSVVCPILDEVIMGYNCTVFAYGQTGTGKTFTMEGERSPNEEYTWEEDPLAGIIPRTLHQIFEKLTENGTEFSVKVSLLEIYNEELFDLLNPTPDVGERLQMFDDPRNRRGVIIKGLEEVTVHNKNQVYQILERGAAKRTTAATYMNAYSRYRSSSFQKLCFVLVMEEEVKKITELFTVSKNELQQCKAHLQIKEKELEETQKDLQETKVHLAEEEYVVSVLENNEQKLHGTASKLLSTVEETTKDVSGLHAKLDRKEAVEQHNAVVQNTFAVQMNALFNKIQDSLSENSLKQQQMLTSYTNFIGDLLSTSSSTADILASVMSAACASVKELVSTEISHVSEKITQHENLSLDCKAELLRLIEKHETGLGRALNSLSPVVEFVLGLNCRFQSNVKKYSAVADQMEDHKREMDTFFGGLSLTLKKIREEVDSGFAELQHNCDNLKEELEMTRLAHAKRTAEFMSSLQSQLDVFAQETQENLTKVLRRNGSLKTTITAMQENVHLKTTDLVSSTNSNHDKCTASLDNFSQELRGINAENKMMLEESSEHCQHLLNNLKDMSQDTKNWCEFTTAQMVSFTDQQLLSFSDEKQQFQCLQKKSEEHCDKTIAEIADRSSRQVAAEGKLLNGFLDQIKVDKEILLEQKLALSNEVQHGLTQVNGFLQEDLKVDIPTGTTPQRRDYSYPVTLVRTEPRELLLEQLRQKQCKLDALLSSMTEEVEDNAGQDLLEEEGVLQEPNESLASDKSLVDTNVYCHTNGGIPFFQQRSRRKKGKENKSAVTVENKMEDTTEELLHESKHPLRLLN